MTFTFTTHQPFIIFFSHPSLKYAFYSLKDLYLLAPLLHSRDCSTNTNTHACTGVRLYLYHRLHPQVQTSPSLDSLFPATPLCWVNFTDMGTGTEGTYCSHTLKREPPLLLAWFKSCSLMKLFKMCSLHFNTHFQFECDYTFRWKRMAIIKLAYYHTTWMCFSESCMKNLWKPAYLKWNHNTLQMHCCGLVISPFFSAYKDKMAFNYYCKCTSVWLWI